MRPWRPYGGRRIDWKNLRARPCATRFKITPAGRTDRTRRNAADAESVRSRHGAYTGRRPGWSEYWDSADSSGSQKRRPPNPFGMIHLDTSLLIDVFTGEKLLAPRLRQFLEGGQRISFNVLVLFEWLRGPHSRTDRRSGGVISSCRRDSIRIGRSAPGGGDLP